MRATRWQLRCSALVLGAALATMPTVAATAAGGGSCDPNLVACPPDGATASDGAVSVTVTATGTRGSGGFTIDADPVWVQPTCWFKRSSWTGSGMVEYAERIGSTPGMIYLPDGATNGPDLSPERMAEFADDSEGVWYYAKCSGRKHFGDSETFEAIRDAYLATNDWLFVPAGTPPPVAEISVETLMEIAFEYLELPDPEVGWNPKLSGNAATIVNMDTWVWLIDPAEELTITATAGANSAEVFAAQRSMTLSAPGADDVECVGSGVEWTPGATGACAIVFTRSSAHQPDLTTPLTVATAWETSWTANGVDRGALEPQTMTSVVGVPVAEVQTIVVSER